MNTRILPLVSLIIAIGIFFTYVKPTWSGPIAETRSIISANKSALVSADEYKKRQNILLSERDAIDSANLAKLSTFLPDSVDNVGLILDINALATRSGLSLTDIDVLASSADNSGSDPEAQLGTLPTAQINPIGTIDLTLTAVGTYTAFQKFLIGLEKSARLLNVRDIAIKGSDTGIYNYEMKVRLYWLR